MDVQRRRDPTPLEPEALEDPRLPDLERWGRRLTEEGLSPEASGNLSCRTSRGFLITRTGVPLGAIEREDWVEVDGLDREEDGHVSVRSRGIADASRDAAVHAVVYARRPEAEAIFHLHVGRLDEITLRLGVPATERYFAAGTVESMREIERILDLHPETRYLVLIDHGILAWGETPDTVGSLVEDRQRALEGPSE